VHGCRPRHNCAILPPVAPADPRRARWTLRVTGLLFLAAVAFSLLTAASTVSWLGAAFHAGRPVLSEAMASARGEQQEDFVRRFDGTRGALASAGWALGPTDTGARFECWVEQDESVCGLFAHTEVSAAVPAAAAAQLPEVDRMFATASTTLADGGWQCSQPLARAPGGTLDVTCTSGRTKLEVICRTQTPGTAGGYPRLTLELHQSREAYRSDGNGSSV